MAPSERRSAVFDATDARPTTLGAVRLDVDVDRLDRGSEGNGTTLLTGPATSVFDVASVWTRRELMRSCRLSRARVGAARPPAMHTNEGPPYRESWTGRRSSTR
jgi:hypothetical protein